MTRFALLALMILTGSVASAAEPTSLVGRWKVAWSQEDGPRVEPRGGDEYVFDGQTLTHFYQGVQDPLFLFQYRVDEASQPHTIDLRFQGLEPPALGLYAIEGERLTLCFRRAAEADRRPDRLDSAAGSGRNLLVLERQR